MSNTMRKLVNFPVGIRTTKSALTDQDIPNLAQVQSIVAGNSSVKEAVAAESDTNFDLGTGGLPILDAYQVLDGDRVLLHSQTDSIENGIYIANPGAWQRASDADEQSELAPYTKVTVLNGDNSGRTYQLLNTTAPVVGTDGQNWAVVSQFSGAAADTTLNETNLSNFSGANVQAALESVDDAFDIATTDLESVRARVSSLIGTNGNELPVIDGGVVPNGSNLVQALESLSAATNAAAGTYAEGRFQSGNLILATGAQTAVDHNLNEVYPSMIEVYSLSTNEKITHTLTITAVTANRIIVQNDDVPVDAVVVVRK